MQGRLKDHCLEAAPATPHSLGCARLLLCHCNWRQARGDVNATCFRWITVVYTVSPNISYTDATRVIQHWFLSVWARDRRDAKNSSETHHLDSWKDDIVNKQDKERTTRAGKKTRRGTKAACFFSINFQEARPCSPWASARLLFRLITNWVISLRKGANKRERKN